MSDFNSNFFAVGFDNDNSKDSYLEDYYGRVTEVFFMYSLLLVFSIFVAISMFQIVGSRSIFIFLFTVAFFCFISFLFIFLFKIERRELLSFKNYLMGVVK